MQGQRREFHLRSATLTGPSLRVLQVLLAFANRHTREVTCGSSRVAEILEYKVPTVQRSILELERGGLISLVPEKRSVLVNDRPQKRLPQKNNEGISARFRKTWPGLVSPLERILVAVESTDGEDRSNPQRSAARAALESLLQSNPNALGWILGNQDTFHQRVVERSTGWARPGRRGRSLGYGKRIAWVIKNVVGPEIPTQTAAERAAETQDQLSKGANPFL